MTIASLTFGAFALAPLALAQGLRQPNPSDTGTPVPQYPTPTPEVSTCSANLITKLCDYKKPASGTAVASSGPKKCMEYCNSHPPCNFVIFAAGNPYTGSGTCWLYPGETFDKSLGKDGCDYLTVYDKPTCASDPSATSSASACAATASPSAVASVCGYPSPDDNCWSSCKAATGSVQCLSQCAKAEECAYAVFNTKGGEGAAYQSGTCWMYPNGTYDATKAKTCSGMPEQFVYANPCPKPAKAVVSGASSSGAGASTSGNGASPTPTGTGGNQGAQAQGASSGGNNPQGAAGVNGASLEGTVAVGIAVLLWQGLR